MSNGTKQQTEPAHLNQVALDAIQRILTEMHQTHPNQALLGKIHDTLVNIKSDLAALTVNISDASVAKIAGAVRPQQARGSADLAALFKIMRGADVHNTGL